MYVHNIYNCAVVVFWAKLMAKKIIKHKTPGDIEEAICSFSSVSHRYATHRYATHRYVVFKQERTAEKGESPNNAYRSNQNKLSCSKIDYTNLVICSN